GFYLGINGGGGWGRSQWDAVDTFDLSGGLIGGTVGYNWQFGQAVIGAGGDIGWSGITGTTHGLCPGGWGTRNQGLCPARGGGGWALAAPVSCRTSPAGWRSGTSMPTGRASRAAASATPAGPSAPDSKSVW